LFAQNFPGMEWLPVIVLVAAFVFISVVAGGAILISRLLPLRSIRPPIASKIRWSVAAIITLSVLVLSVRSCAPLGGPDPSQRIAVGMSAHEVRAALGKPHEQHRDAEGQETWIYYRDWAGTRYYLIRLDRDGKVYMQWLE
jgi:hypothetical protein